MRPRILTILILSLIALPLRAQNTDELKRKAEVGDAKAQNELGVAYLTGDGVDRNKQEAVKWYLKAAKQGLSDAMFNLGMAYYNGDGVFTDVNRANAWFMLASSAGSTEAKQAMERIKNEEPRPTLGITERLIGLIYATDLAPNPAKSLEWLTKAATDEDPPSAAELCIRQLKGDGVPKDTDAGMHWCEWDAKHGDPSILIFVADSFFKGNGLPQDIGRATRVYEQAAALRVPVGAMRLASLYMTGTGVSKDEVVGYSWLLIANSQGYSATKKVLDQITPTLSEKQVSEAKKTALQWWNSHNQVGRMR